MSKNRTSVKMMYTLPAWQVDLIDQICNAMRSYYCLPKKFGDSEHDFKQSLVDTFNVINKQELKSDEPSSKEEYLIYVNAINKTIGIFDPHLEIEYNKDFISERKNHGEIIKNREKNSARFDFGSGPPQQILFEMNQYRGKPEINYGFTNTPKEKAVIPPTIGYLKISFLLDPQTGVGEKDEKYRVGPNAIKALNDAMSKMVAKKGIILDLRDAPEGGSPEMVQYIVSFFIKQKGMIINEIDDRITGIRTPYKTVDTPHQLFDVPVDILTDETTFSAREELAYDFQQLNIQLQKDGKQVGDRFHIIGGVTRGGAHPEYSFPLLSSSGEINEHLVLRIPCKNSINPTSGTNWEDQKIKGVQPDQKVDKENALMVSVEHLNKIIQKNESKKSTEFPVSTQSIFSQPRESLIKTDNQDEKKNQVHRKKVE